MGTKNSKGVVSIEHIGKRIRLRWRFQKQRYSLNLFRFSKSNLLQAKEIAVLLEGDLTRASFDFSLQRYKPSNFQKTTGPRKTLVEYFETWVKDYRNMDCDMDIDYFSTRNMMRRWGDFDSSTLIFHYNKEKIAACTYNRRLTLLRSFFQWTTKTKVTVENPLEDVLPKKTRRGEKENRKPFTELEIRRILEAVRNNSYCSKYTLFKHSHYYPFLFFMFKTGVRNAEAVGLRVKHVNLLDNSLLIKEILARSLKGSNSAARIRKETKNKTERIIPLTEDLKAILVPLIEYRKPDELVFTSHTGKSIDDMKFQKRIFRRILQELGIKHRVLYACRHTFSSRCTEAGMTPVSVAFLMGNNPVTALRNYTHLLSHPTNLPSIL